MSHSEEASFLKNVLACLPDAGSVNFSLCPWLDCWGQLAIPVLLAEIPAHLQPCPPLLVSSLFCCASKVHFVSFPPFSLGVSDSCSLHLNRRSGTSILKRLRRRRNHQYVTEHTKLHHSPFSILMSALVSLGFSISWVTSASLWSLSVWIACFPPCLALTRSCEEFVQGQQSGSPEVADFLGKATAGVSASQPMLQASFLLVFNLCSDSRWS